MTLPGPISVAELFEAFPRPLTKATATPFFFVLAGLPASGKSTFARDLAARLPVAHVASDQLRSWLTGGVMTHTGEESHLVHTAAANLARRLLHEGYHVMLDATNVVRRDRRRVTAIGPAAGAVPVIIWCEVDDSTAATWLAYRAAGKNPDDFSRADGAVRERMKTRTTPPDAEEAPYVFRVGSPEERTAVIDKILALMENL